MANLIITVIAIALVAVASLMGAYYGGSAFLNNQSAANAATVLNEGQQIAGAWQAYLNANQNVPPATGMVLLVSQQYIAAAPSAPAAPGVAAAPMAIGTVGAHYYAYADMGTVASDPNGAACLRIAKTAVGTGGTNAAATVAEGSISAAGTTYGNGTFGCAQSKTPATVVSGTLPTTGDWTMEYLLQ